MQELVTGTEAESAAASRAQKQAASSSCCLGGLQEKREWEAGCQEKNYNISIQTTQMPILQFKTPIVRVMPKQ